MTTTIKDFGGLNNNVTPELPDGITYFDADEELAPIAEYLKEKTEHHGDIDVPRIKFVYNTNPKKEGGRYIMGDVVLRSELEKIVNDDFDYIASVYYHVWKDLDIENKVIQLDKILCGIDLGSMDSPKLGKKQKDSREHIDNMRYFGPDKVMKSSEMVHLAAERIAEQEKEKKKQKKEKKGEKTASETLSEAN